MIACKLTNDSEQEKSGLKQVRLCFKYEIANKARTIVTAKKGHNTPNEQMCMKEKNLMLEYRSPCNETGFWIKPSKLYRYKQLHTQTWSALCDVRRNSEPMVVGMKTSTISWILVWLSGEMNFIAPFQYRIYCKTSYFEADFLVRRNDLVTVLKVLFWFKTRIKFW